VAVLMGKGEMVGETGERRKKERARAEELFSTADNSGNVTV